MDVPKLELGNATNPKLELGNETSTATGHPGLA